MNEYVQIIIAEDDEGHAALIKKNLERVGIKTPILHFKDGQELLDFFFQNTLDTQRINNKGYLLLLDIRMPRVDGVDALIKIKENSELRKIPVIMLTTSDNPNEIERCHSIGCSHYIHKPVSYDSFVDTVQRLGLFLDIVKVPTINY